MEPETGFHRPDSILNDPQITGDDAHDSRNIIRTICAMICITLLLIMAATALSADDGAKDNQTVRVSGQRTRGK